MLSQLSSQFYLIFLLTLFKDPLKLPTKKNSSYTTNYAIGTDSSVTKTTIPTTETHFSVHVRSNSNLSTSPSVSPLKFRSSKIISDAASSSHRRAASSPLHNNIIKNRVSRDTLSPIKNSPPTGKIQLRGSEKEKIKLESQSSSPAPQLQQTL